MASAQASSLGIRGATGTVQAFELGFGFFLFGIIFIIIGVLLAVFNIVLDICFISGHSFIFFGFILFAIGIWATKYLRISLTQKFIIGIIIMVIGWVVGWMVVSWL